MDPEKFPNESDSRYSPGIGKRLLWWFGIYFIPQVLLIGFIPFFYLFPTGLSYLIDPKLPKIGGQPTMLGYAPYAVYVAHFVLSMVIPSRRIFTVLMAVLIIIVCLNVYGCMQTVPDLKDIKG